MLQIHLDIDPNSKQGLGLALAIFNAIGQFAVHSGQHLTDQPQQGPQGPAPAAAPAAAPKPRKPRGGAAAAQPPVNGPDGQEPELFPHAHPQPMPGAPVASFGQPVPGGMPQQPQVPDVRVKLRDDLSRFSVTCGPMALQGLLAYFGANKSSELPMDRLEEIYGYMRAAYAQMQQGQNA